MGFEFHWKNKEANFGLPEEKEINGGTHFTVEIILRHNKKFVIVRRPNGYPGHQLPPKSEHFPQGCLYFCHGLPRWGESVNEAVKRIVKSQIDTGIKNFNVVHLEMGKYPDDLHEGNKHLMLKISPVEWPGGKKTSSGFLLNNTYNELSEDSGHIIITTLFTYSL